MRRRILIRDKETREQAKRATRPPTQTTEWTTKFLTKKKWEIRHSAKMPFKDALMA